MQVQSNGAGASASEAVEAMEAMEAADNVAGLQQKDQRDYQKSKGQKISRGIFPPKIKHIIVNKNVFKVQN
jgi:hypothetical protein